jgi:hypothetical protein
MLVLYRPHGPGAVHGGPESNRVMPGSPDGLPARSKHVTTHASGRPRPVSYRARPCSCRAKWCGPRAGPFNTGQIFRNCMCRLTSFWLFPPVFSTPATTSRLLPSRIILAFQTPIQCVARVHAPVDTYQVPMHTSVCRPFIHPSLPSHA